MSSSIVESSLRLSLNGPKRHAVPVESPLAGAQNPGTAVTGPSGEEALRPRPLVQLLVTVSRPAKLWEIETGRGAQYRKGIQKRASPR